MIDASPAYRNAAEILTAGESHRVWSLIVTIFGDLARREGDEISGALLARLVGLMGVRPEAMRVALHRLRKDGWIESRREGRGSQHFLTRSGRRQSAEASPRIYDAERRFPDRWHMLVSGTGEATGRSQLDSFLLTGDYLPIGTQVVLGAGPLPVDARGLLGAGISRWSVPDWVQDQVCPADLMAQYAALARDLERLLGIVSQGLRLPVMERVALRLLTVHSWRRLLFRHPDLPEIFFPEEWLGPQCRGRFASLMQILPAADLNDLEQVVTDSESIPRQRIG